MWDTGVGIIIRTLPDRLIIDDAVDGALYEEYNEDNEVLLPEVKWCLETYGRVPTVFYDDPVDAAEHDRKWLGYWTIWFRSNEEAVAFKLKWF